MLAYLVLARIQSFCRELIDFFRQRSVFVFTSRILLNDPGLRLFHSIF